jgi:uncharacterized protein
MKRILISGGSGLVGIATTQLLLENNYEVVHLSRRENLSGMVKAYRWDVDSGVLDERSLEGIDALIHLAGTGIADSRWTEQRKKEIIDSRVKSSELLFSRIKKKGIKLTTFIGASATGIYGAVTSDKIFNEQDPPASDFLGTCCKLWENSYVPVISSGVRTVVLRIPPVLSDRGGALVKMVGPIKKGFGSALGSGKQFLPWIHEKDMARIILFALREEKMSGIYNAVAPAHLTNEELTALIAKQLNKKLWAPKVPAFVLRLMFGEMAGMFLEGSRVSSEKIEAAGFRFSFPRIDGALADLLRRQ